MVDKERSIASVAASYGLVAQTVGNWVAKYRKQHADAREQKEATDAEELARLKAENYKLRMENEFPQESGGLLREGTAVTTRYELISREEGNYPVAWMCQWAKVSKSGYYNWRSKPESATAIRRKELGVLVEKIFDESDGTYGYRRVAATLESGVAGGAGRRGHGQVDHAGAGLEGRAAAPEGPYYGSGGGPG
ncbi:hypothetical protein BW737_009520 [Actinomyces ruminis]|uniref:HTH-like domain-containing protein n=1 Tax=Actinomyces ruminis TaxID=1937003 RepID=A0ABX4MAA3_9ACTO|nr:hypothetical protein BW737_009520 [Actinomyces ruminis]